MSDLVNVQAIYCRQKKLYMSGKCRIIILENIIIRFKEGIMDRKEIHSGESTSFLEKVLYGLGDVGVNLIWILPSSFLTMYYTDSALLSASFVGTMMLICRLFDGISDIFMGMIIDKTKTRFGKARPWLLFMSLPLILSVALAFYVPAGISNGTKQIYSFVTYFIMSVICYTAVNLSYHSMLPRFSLTSQDRCSVSAVRSVFSMIATIVVSTITPLIIEKFGGYNRQMAWTVTVLIYGVIAELCILITFFGIKEKLPVEIGTSGEKQSRKEIAEGIKILLSSKYFYISVFLFLTFYISSGTSGIMIYLARDIYGNTDYFGLLNLAGMIPMLVVVPFMPALYKKAGKRNAMLIGAVVAVIIGIFKFLFVKNFVVFLMLQFLGSVASCPLCAALYTLAGDIVDYNQWKYNIRSEGITTSVNSIGMKLGTGLGSAMLGWLLAWGKYDGTLTTQPESALNAMIIIATIIPIFVNAIAAILLIKWDLEKYQKEVSEFIAGQAKK